MRSKLLLVAGLLAVCLTGSLRAQTVDEIIQLNQQKVSEQILLATVEKAPNDYSLSAADIVKLKDAKVPDSVVTAMLRHRATAQAAPAAPAIPPPAATASASAPAGTGVLGLENLDNQTWAYGYEPAAQTIWFSPPTKDGRGKLTPSGGTNLRMNPGTYKLRYTGQTDGPSVSVSAGAKAQVMLTRVATAERETLYVSVFENGEHKEGGLLAVLRDSHAAGNAGSQSEEVNAAPPPVVVQPAPAVIYTAPVPYYPPVYYPPVYPYYGFGFRYGPYRHGPGVSIGIGIP